jgi:hypothetical protein
MESSVTGETDWGVEVVGCASFGVFPADCEKTVVILSGVCELEVGVLSLSAGFSVLTAVGFGIVVVLAPGFLVGSKFMIRIFGIHPSVESNPSVLADLFFPGAGDVGDVGGEPMATRDARRCAVTDAVKKELAVDALTSLNRMPLRCTLNLATLNSNQNQGFLSDEMAGLGPLKWLSYLSMSQA